jgi:hypothetical protein
MQRILNKLAQAEAYAGKIKTCCQWCFPGSRTHAYPPGVERCPYDKAWFVVPDVLSEEAWQLGTKESAVERE